MVSSSALAWCWVVETLADVKEVNPSILQAVISTLPSFYSNAPATVREKVALKYLEESVGKGRSDSSSIPSGSRSFIDVSQSSEDALRCYLKKVSELHQPERNNRQRFRHYFRQYVLHKRAKMPKSSLYLLKESILEGHSTVLSSLKEHSGLTVHGQEDVPQCNASGEHEAVKENIINVDSGEECSGGQNPTTAAPSNCDPNLNAPPNDNREEVNPSSGKEDHFHGDVDVQPGPPIDEDSDNDPCDFEFTDMVVTEKHRMLDSQLQTIHDSAGGNLEQSFCLKCYKGGELLTCRANGCPVAVHKHCLDPAVRFDKTGLFYCPFCSYARAAVAYSKARKNLSLFVGKDIAEGHREEKSPGRYQASFEKDTGHHLDDRSCQHQTNRLDVSYTEGEDNQQMETASNKDKQPVGSLKDIGIYDAFVSLQKSDGKMMDNEHSSTPAENSTDNLLAENLQTQPVEPHSAVYIGNLSLKDVDKSQASNKDKQPTRSLEDIGRYKYNASVSLQKLNDKRMDNESAPTPVENSTQNMLAEDQQPQPAEPHSASNISDLSLKDVDKSQATYEASIVQQNVDNGLGDDHINNQQLKSSDQVETAPGNVTRMQLRSSPQVQIALGDEIGKTASPSRNRRELRSSSQVQTAPSNDIGDKTSPSINSQRHPRKRSRDTDTVETRHPQAIIENQMRYKSSLRRNRMRENQPERYSMTGRRNKLPWTVEEEEALREAMQKFDSKKGLVPWKDILISGGNVFHKTRQPGDLKDKWRNIMIKEGYKR